MQEREISWLTGWKGDYGEVWRGGKGLETGPKEAAEDSEAGRVSSNATVCVLARSGLQFGPLSFLLVQVSKSKEGVLAWGSLSLSCGDGLRRQRRKRSWFLQSLKREESSASHQDCAEGGHPKGCWGCYEGVCVKM